MFGDLKGVTGHGSTSGIIQAERSVKSNDMLETGQQLLMYTNMYIACIYELCVYLDIYIYNVCMHVM